MMVSLQLSARRTTMRLSVTVAKALLCRTCSLASAKLTSSARLGEGACAGTTSLIMRRRIRGVGADRAGVDDIASLDFVSANVSADPIQRRRPENKTGDRPRV